MVMRSRSRGIAFIVVVWVLALLAVLLAGFSVIARTEALQADAAQQAGAASALLVLLVVAFSLLARYLSYRIDTKMGGNKR